jgi:catechol 2,3-dioxygenase-like lactoylglutathione lyase family enzyme
MIRQIKFVSVPVRDQDRALAFYRDKLGFKVATDQPFDANQRWIELKIPGAETGVVLFTPKGQEDRVGTFFNGSLACDDVQKTYEELKGRGVEFQGEPKKETWGTFVIFKDSEGNQLVLGSR